jgi:hypothetical protein
VRETVRVFASHAVRRSRPIVAAVLAAVVLSVAGCSSGRDQTVGPTGSGGPATPVAAGSLSELADHLGCTGLAPATDNVEPTAQAQGTCTVAGGTVTLYLFGTADALQTWSDSSVRAPDVAAVLFGGTWAISFPTRDAGQTAQQRLGGRLV